MKHGRIAAQDIYVFMDELNPRKSWTSCVSA